MEIGRQHKMHYEMGLGCRPPHHNYMLHTVYDGITFIIIVNVWSGQVEELCDSKFLSN